MSRLLSRLCLVSLGGIALLTSGCSSAKMDDKEAKPVTASLARSLDMVDKDGRHYGTVEMDPVGGGKVLDNDGRLVGTIVPPSLK